MRNTIQLFIFLLLPFLFSCKQDTLYTKANVYFKPLPEAKIVNDDKVKLGEMLFYENRISSDGKTSCSSCHPAGNYLVDGLTTAVGNHGKTNPRNSPTLLNAALQLSQHWRGDRESVEEQARKSLTGKASFGAPSEKWVEEQLSNISEYHKLFSIAFPGEKNPITVANFSIAVGSWERTLFFKAPFDRYLEGEKDALTTSQKKGLEAFIETGCVSCHNGPFVGGSMYQKFGVYEDYWKYTKSAKVDLGRADVTKKDSDKYIFKVPMLRNVVKTSPYFHDGSVRDLKDAIRIMAKVQLGKDLSSEKIDLIHDFLTSLTSVIPSGKLKKPSMPQ